MAQGLLQGPHKATSTLEVVDKLTADGEAAVGSHLTVNGWSLLKERVVYQDAGGTDWTVQSAGGALSFYPNGNYAGPSIHFFNNMEVAFPGLVTIGVCQSAGLTNCPTSSSSTPTSFGSAKLAVGGPIAVMGKVTVVNYGAAWPDYVFRRGYRLRPLAEVGRYVQQHQHLPEVPSAAQVQAQGVELVQMNATLLQKVEELTLYLLQEQAAHQALAQRVARLEAKLQATK